VSRAKASLKSGDPNRAILIKIYGKEISFNKLEKIFFAGCQYRQGRA